jgi:SET domain-containing protein
VDFINHQPIETKLIDNELVEVSGPNCIKEKSRPVGNKTEWNLITRRDIKAGEELTLHYTFYKPL